MNKLKIVFGIVAIIVLSGCGDEPLRTFHDRTKDCFIEASIECGEGNVGNVNANIIPCGYICKDYAKFITEPQQWTQQ